MSRKRSAGTFWSWLRGTTDGRARRLRRRVGAEPLETRRLLAANMRFQNFHDPEDVNADGSVTAVDALTVVNVINQDEGGEVAVYADVSGDGLMSAHDALLVMNRLRSTTGRSGLTPADRMARIESALERDVLPSSISTDQAESVLATLRHGGLPELGDRFEGGRLIAARGVNRAMVADHSTDSQTVDESSQRSTETVNHLRGVRQRLLSGDRPDPAQIAVRLQDALDSGDLPEWIDVERAETIVTTLENGENPFASRTLVGLNGDRPDSAQVGARLRAALDSGDLPEWIDVERAETIVTTLENGENPFASRTLVGLNGDRPDSAQVGARLRAALDSGDLPEWIDVERAETIVTTLENGEDPFASRTLVGLNGDRPDPAQIAVRLRAALDSGDLPEWIDVERAETIVTTLENGENPFASRTLVGLNGQRPDPAQIAVRLQDALDSGDLPEWVDVERAETIVATLENGENPFASRTLVGLNGQRPDPAQIAVRLQDALDSGDLPEWIDAERAETIVATLENGEDPVVGRALFAGRSAMRTLPGFAANRARFSAQAPHGNTLQMGGQIGRFMTASLAPSMVDQVFRGRP